MGNKKINHTNCLSTTHPHLLDEWDWDKNGKLLIEPNNIASQSNKKCFWVCSKNKEHKWETRIQERTRKDGKHTSCPYCSNKKINHTNCLSTTHPHLLDEWDWDKNEVKPEKISYCSSKKVFWICSKNFEHTWFISPNMRTSKHNKTGCPYCSNKKINHTNCLSTTHPHLLDEWDWDKNEVKPSQISSGSIKKIWWLCSLKKHSWKTSLRHRTEKLTGCPLCSKHYSKGHKQVVEYIKSIYNGKIEINNRNIIINPETGFFLELDIYLPEIKFAIEYNGEYYHSKKKIQKRDKMKQRLCEEKEIRLLQIWEKDWKQKPESIYREIRNYV